MDKNDFLNKLSNPSSLTEEDVRQLESIISEHTYSPLSHFILAKYHHLINSVEKEKYLQQASAYALDRRILKDYVTNDNFQLPPRSTKPVKGTDQFLDNETVSVTPAEISDREIEELKEGKEENTIIHQSFPEIEETEKTHEISEEELDQLKERLSSESASKITKEIITEVMSEEYDFFEKIDKDHHNNDNKLSQTEESIRQIEEDAIPEDESEDLIDRFIRLRPSLIRPTANSPKDNQEDLSEKSLTTEAEMVSENLAVILAKQGKTEKAIDIYKKLIWKYPQKKSYFANRIEELKK